MIRSHVRTLATALCVACMVMNPFVDAWGAIKPNPAESYPTTTPIKHVVVIFQENISFDHYFATYPYAANPQGEPVFNAAEATPGVNGLSAGLLTDNPNVNASNGSGAANPFRLDRSQVIVCHGMLCMVLLVATGFPPTRLSWLGGTGYSRLSESR